MFKNIKIIKLSLLELLDDKTNKNEFILRSSGSFKLQKYFKTKGIFNIDTNICINEICLIVNAIYKDLVDNNTYDVNHLSIHITMLDDTIYENSIKISVLDDIKKYGNVDLNPLLEFIKMTIQ